ncbi:MAG: YitT family protein [Velocimicrobium sp.]
MKQLIHSNYKNIVLILLGNLIYTLAVAMFILPNNLITGGTTGLSLVVTRFFPIPISTFILLSNVLLFILGAVVLGKRFAITTLLSTFFYPLCLAITTHIKGLSNFTNNPMLATVCAGFMIGFGIGIVIKAGASTGGLDIPPLILNKKLGLPVSVSLYMIDFIILLLQMAFSSKEKTLYGILLVLIYSIVLDKVLLTGSAKTQVKIVSKKYEEINTMIILQLDRGSTLMNAETGFYRSATKVVLTIISSRELSKLNSMVQSIDPNAFMIINQVNEVKGRGFTLDREYH